jgi:glycosyltransferase involved in cell wall biosynthesis
MKKKILFLCNHTSFFISHRLNIYLEARKRKYDFLLVTGKSSSIEMEKKALKVVKKYNISHKILNFNSYRLNIIDDLSSIIQIKNIIKKYEPDIFHTVAPKTNLYGGIVSNFSKIKLTIISFSGMGFLFSGNLSLINIVKKFLYTKALNFIFINKNLKVIVQNKDDFFFIKKNYNLKERLKLIKGGSGIDLNKFDKLKIKKNKNIVFSGRLVKNKGIVEFINAAIFLKKKYPDWNFLIYGAKDYLSHDEFNLDNFKDLLKKKIIIYKGYKQNISRILENSCIFCLPSYREGMPKSVLEASAAGIPSVVANTIGCKEAVIHNKTGLLAKSKDYKDLSLKIEMLIKNKNLRNFFSKNAKKFVKTNSSLELVTKKIFNLYEK